MKAKDRFSSEEARAIDRLQIDMYNEVRQVGTVVGPAQQLFSLSWFERILKYSYKSVFEVTINLFYNQGCVWWVTVLLKFVISPWII